MFQVTLLLSALLALSRELRSMSAERAQYFHHGKHWIQLVLGLLSMTTAIMQLCFQSHARSCVSEVSKILPFLDSFRFACPFLYRFTVNEKKKQLNDAMKYKFVI